MLPPLQNAHSAVGDRFRRASTITADAPSRSLHMGLRAFGMNYETAPLAIREWHTLTRDQAISLYRRCELSPEAEFIVLSTCNRTEVYLYGSTGDARSIQAALSELSGRAWPREYSFEMAQDALVRHVFHLAAGLKSQVLGDAQILNQVKSAYRLAADENAVGPVLHRLIQTAFRTARRVIGETAVSKSTATVSALAVTAACKVLGNGAAEGLRNRKILLLGAGETGALALKALKKYAPSALWVSNRSSARAEVIAAKTGATPIQWSQRAEAIAQADLVIVATGADAYVVDEGDVRPRPDASALVIDIAMPRNVNPAVSNVPGYRVLDLDTLENWRDDLDDTRRADVPLAERFCEEGVDDYLGWLTDHVALKPAIDALRETFEAIRMQETDRHARLMPDAARAQIDRITRSIMQKLLAIPIARIKNAALNGGSHTDGVRLLNALFSPSECDNEVGACLTDEPSDAPRCAQGGRCCGRVAGERSRYSPRAWRCDTMPSLAAEPRQRHPRTEHGCEPT